MEWDGENHGEDEETEQEEDSERGIEKAKGRQGKRADRKSSK